MNKEKEIILANYIIEDSSLLLKKSLKDIQIKNTGQVVELKLYYKPVSKAEYKWLRWRFCKESQHVLTTFENGMLCGKFLAKTKYKDLIICKMHTYTPKLGEKKLLNSLELNNRKVRTARDELSGLIFLFFWFLNTHYLIFEIFAFRFRIFILFPNIMIWS